MSRTKKDYINDVSFVLTSSSITLFLGFVLRTILGNFLGPSGLGLYTMVISIYMIAAVCGDMGLSAAIVKYIAESRDEQRKVKVYATSSIISVLILGLILSILFLIGSVKIASFFGMPELVNLLKIIALIFPSLLINYVLLGLLNGLRRMKYYSITLIFQRMLGLLVTLILLYYGWDIKGAVIGLVISSIFTLILLTWGVKDFIIKIDLKEYYKSTTELLKFGVQIQLTNIISTTSAHLNILIIGYFLTSEDVGIFAIALMFRDALLIIPYSIQKINYPTISEYYVKNQMMKIEKVINNSLKYTLLILAMFGMSVAFLIDEIIVILIRDEFLSSAILFKILLIGLVFYGPMVSVATTFSSIGRPDISLKISVVSIFINSILLLILTPLMGIEGAAVAISIHNVLISGLYVYLIKKKLGIKVKFIDFSNVLRTLSPWRQR